MKHSFKLFYILNDKAGSVDLPTLAKANKYAKEYYRAGMIVLYLEKDGKMLWQTIHNMKRSQSHENLR